MRKENLLLRCFAQQDPDGSWFAMCVDLNLYARAGSLAEAKDQLRQIVADFVREALTDDREYAADLLCRRTPLSFWVRYYWYRFLCGLSHDRTGGDSQRPARHIPYDAPLPMAPA